MGWNNLQIQCLREAMANSSREIRNIHSEIMMTQGLLLRQQNISEPSIIMKHVDNMHSTVLKRSSEILLFAQHLLKIFTTFKISYIYVQYILDKTQRSVCDNIARLRRISSIGMYTLRRGEGLHIQYKLHLYRTQTLH